MSKKFRWLIAGTLFLVIVIGLGFLLIGGSSDSRRQMAISYRDLALPLMLETGALSADIQKTMLGFASGGIYQHEAVSILSRAQSQCANIAGQVKNIRPGYSE